MIIFIAIDGDVDNPFRPTGYMNNTIGVYYKILIHKSQQAALSSSNTSGLVVSVLGLVSSAH